MAAINEVKWRQLAGLCREPIQDGFSARSAVDEICRIATNWSRQAGGNPQQLVLRKLWYESYGFREDHHEDAKQYWNPPSINWNQEGIDYRHHQYAQTVLQWMIDDVDAMEKRPHKHDLCTSKLIVATIQSDAVVRSRARGEDLPPRRFNSESQYVLSASGYRTDQHKEASTAEIAVFRKQYSTILHWLLYALGSLGPVGAFQNSATIEERLIWYESCA